MVYNVVYISDDNYVVPTKASINSIKKNCAEQEFVIHIIAVEVSAEHQVEFESLATDNLRIDIINVQNEFRDLGLGHHYISKADLFKFKLPVLFKNLDRILYVDGDMIMSSEFTEIYTYDISNVYGGVCLDVFSTKEGKWNEYVGHHCCPINSPNSQITRGNLTEDWVSVAFFHSHQRTISQDFDA